MFDLSKRYWLFNFPDYYPSGGLDDVYMTADTIEEFTNIGGYKLEIYGDVLPVLIISDNCYIYDKVNNERIEYPK